MLLREKLFDFFSVFLLLFVGEIRLFCIQFDCFLNHADDGALSMAEFKTFFSDGILSEQDLEKLFNEIDTHNTA